MVRLNGNGTEGKVGTLGTEGIGGTVRTGKESSLTNCGSTVILNKEETIIDSGKTMETAFLLRSGEEGT